MIKCNLMNSTSLLVINSKGLFLHVIHYAIRNLPPSVAFGVRETYYLPTTIPATILTKGLW